MSAVLTYEWERPHPKFSWWRSCSWCYLNIESKNPTAKDRATLLNATLTGCSFSVKMLPRLEWMVNLRTVELPPSDFYYYAQKNWRGQEIVLAILPYDEDGTKAVIDHLIKKAAEHPNFKPNTGIFDVTTF